MARTGLALIVLVGLTAFAPAPFPTRERRGESNTAISVARFQGKWKVETFEVYEQGGQKRRSGFIDRVIVKDDLWILSHQDDRPHGSYRIAIRPGKPATIDFYSFAQKGQARGGDKLECFGLIRRDGDTVQILYTYAEGKTRVTSFDNPPANWWLMTLKRIP
jgi:uncharacterized protein (TIGR03067 family)